MESIEGSAASRSAAALPADAGLWGRPTIINNVETLAKAPPIIMHGARSSARWAPRGGRHQLLAVADRWCGPASMRWLSSAAGRRIDDLAGGLAPGGRCGRYHRRHGGHVPRGRASGHAAHLRGLSDGGRHHRRRHGHGLRRHRQYPRRVRPHRQLLAHESSASATRARWACKARPRSWRASPAGRPGPTDAGDLLALAGVMTDTSICGLGQAAALAIVSATNVGPRCFAT